MFLATTALQEFWDDEGPVLLLGTWCLPYPDRKGRSTELQALPCPWDNKSSVEEAYLTAQNTYEKYLSLLVPLLNQQHSVSYSLNYWRIIVGPWLHYYSDVVMDRYEHIKTAFELMPELTSRVLSPCFYQTPTDTLDFINLLMHDPYNLQIYSQIFSAMDFHFPAGPSLELRKAASNILPIGVVKNAQRNSKKISLARNFNRLAGFAAQTLKLGRFQLLDADMSDDQFVSLVMNTQGRLLPPRTFRPPVIKKSDGAQSLDPHPFRKILSALPAANAFEKVFVSLLAQNFPTLYLENYSVMKDWSLNESKKLPPVLLASFGWRFDEALKFLAADAQEKGKRLVAIQHGGAYGTYARHMEEKHEQAIADTCWVWGWADQKKGDLHNVPSPRLSRGISKSSKKQKPILYLATAQPRYPIGLHSSPIGSQWERYFQWQERFMRALTKEIRSQILFRPGVYEYGFYNEMRIKDQFPEVVVSCEGALEEAVSKSRLVVIDYGGATVFLETLARNLPTLHFFDSQISTIRPQAQKAYDELAQAKVFFNDPESCAGQLISVSPSLSEWWTSLDVQHARRNFCDSFALSSPDWKRIWMETLKEEFDRFKKQSHVPRIKSGGLTQIFSPTSISN